MVGVSGFSIYVPRYRISLKTWCEWTGTSWDKVRSTVGNSFRVIGPNQSIYTMAANAALRLILDYEIDPKTVGFLGLGTESSGDNSAGAVIVKGLLDRALEDMGLPRLSRNCEVPEFKHACLGGVYALKAGLRYLSCDGRGRRAIVISADLAEYERGSSGEPTQGACAVAQLLEENPKLYSVNLRETGSAAAYRGVDFRKPHKRHLKTSPLPENTVRMPDYPIFNGNYSTICYTDQALHAVGRLLWKLDLDPRALYRMVEGWFLHRPYHRMPINIMAALYVWGLSRNKERLPELAALCEKADADFDKMLIEAGSSPDLFRGALGGGVNRDVYPESRKTVKYFRYTSKFEQVMSNKMHLGTETMRDMGNVYTASLPAWIAAGLEEALERNLDIGGKVFFSLGYGSGDAAEAMLLRVVDGWEDAAKKIGIKKALEDAIDLSLEEYEALHDGLPGPCPSYEHSGEFVIDSVGTTRDNDFQDAGIEYYRYIP
ncbi:MAG: hydroxymethylglutaryl-CoA synthase family protein [Deltaproteobacteria bacterium]|nr:hydroxymethylglutaryl-CoA synthase family protein [Deltaproteobacteria bacterium]